MAEFLVELYVSRGVESGAERVRLAAEELTRAGTAVRCMRSIFVPDDELCFLLFEAGSVDDVRDAARAADLPFDRISEVTSAELALGTDA